MTTVAFLGLGAIGTPMARHLAVPEFSLSVWNRTAAKATAFAAEFAVRAAATPAEAAMGADFVFCCLVCGHLSADIRQGREFDLVSMEIS